MSEKTEKPTPRKREEARREGRIPKSPELTTALVLLGSALVVNTVGRTLAGTVVETARLALTMAGAAPMDGTAAVTLVQSIGWKVLAALGTFLVAMAGVTVSISAVQARGVMSWQPLAPKWERIDPMTNAKRLFGAQPWVELLKSLLKLGIVGFVVYGAVTAAWPSTMALAQQSPAAFVALLRGFTVRVLMTAGFTYLGMALLDYLYQIWSHEKGLRMSRDEIKREMKESDGDPLVKQRMRSLGRALARRQMFKEVPQADVVITNPTHIAVALKYDPNKADAPIVIAMGKRKIALKIKTIAIEAGVPTVENRPLARALIGSARVGDTIPSALYMAVAEVLAFVMRERAQRPSWRKQVAV